MGTNEYRFNSRPNHSESQLFDVIATMSPRIIVMENRVVKGLEKKFIKIGKESNFPCVGLESLTAPGYFILFNLKSPLVIRELALGEG